MSLWYECGAEWRANNWSSVGQRVSGRVATSTAVKGSDVSDSV